MYTSLPLRYQSKCCRDECESGVQASDPTVFLYVPASQGTHVLESSGVSLIGQSVTAYTYSKPAAMQHTHKTTDKLRVGRGI